jgi:hypothetical protein
MTSFWAICGIEMQIAIKAGINFTEPLKSPCYHKVSNGIMLLFFLAKPCETRKKRNKKVCRIAHTRSNGVRRIVQSGI